MKKQGVMIYLLKGNKVLFLKRKKENENLHKEGIHIPMGGKIEKSESLEDAIKREVMEESDIKLKSSELRGVIYFRDFGKDEDDWIVYIFTSNDFSGSPKDGNEGSFIWATKKEFPKLNLYEGDKIFLDYIFTKKYKLFVVEFLYKKHRLISHKLLSAV